MRDMGAKLDQKSRFRSSLEKSDPPVCQTGVSGFHIEKPMLRIFSKNDLRHFRQDEWNI
jgi:hypothetical protein